MREKASVAGVVNVFSTLPVHTTHSFSKRP